MEYKNANDEISTRQGEPIGLVFYAFTWHLISWCHLRKEYRDFKVSRIIKLRDTGIPFVNQDHPGLNEYMKQLPVSW